MRPDPDQIPGVVSLAEPARRTLLMQALVDTFGHAGARFGAIWIGILVLLAVFAPLIASSYPLAMQMKDGSWRFPLFAGLTAVDLLLLVMFFAVVVLWWMHRWTLGRSILILAVIGAVATPICAWVARPPENVVWESYRRGQDNGEIVKAYHTIIPYSANDRMRDHPEQVRQAPASNHWFGTTVFGEDMLSRMIHASRVALTIGLIATGISVIIGVVLGGLMGYFSGITDLLGMRIVEIVEAIPTLILLLIVSASFPTYGRSIYVIMAVIGLMRWTPNARFIRAEFLKLRNLDFVQAGIAAGLPLRSILFRHMLPNGIAPVLVESSFGIAGAILLESTLSFLGLGLAAEDPSWGQLLNQARSGGSGFNWWIATFPGTAIFLTVFAYILVGEAMRDALDPKLRKSEQIKTMNPLLNVRELNIGFDTNRGEIRPVRDVSFSIYPGQTVALVGESGCGKSVSALSILRLIPSPPGKVLGGQIEFDGRDLLKLPESEMRSVRGKDIAMIFQEPMTSLNPVYTIGDQIVEAIVLHQRVGSKQAYEIAEQSLKDVGIADPHRRLNEYPHQMSGGMRQRVMIAMALSCKPKLLIADEPTTALDVTIQAQILELLRRLQQQTGMAILLITHDLGVVAENADVVNVMYASRIVESATVEDLFDKPMHPYTQGLFRSVPKLGSLNERLATIPGTVPNPARFPGGCKFHTRCARTCELAANNSAETVEIVSTGEKFKILKHCQSDEPLPREIESKHWAACHQIEGYDSKPQTKPHLDHKRTVVPHVVGEVTV